jgi:Flp pilus assembly protein TadD
MTAAPGHARATAVLAFAALFAYYNALHATFVFDDAVFTDDPNLGTPWKAALAPRPVVALTLAANYWAEGLRPRGYHLFNVVAHLAAAVVLYDLVRRTLLLPRFAGRYAAAAGWVGLAAGLVWLVHPLNTQAVTYVVQRCESLMGLFFLASMWCFLRGCTGDRGAWWHAAGALCAGLSMGSKEVAVALPPVLVLYDRAFLAGSWRGALGRWRVVLAYSALPAVGVAWLVLGGVVSGERNNTVGFAVTLFTPASYALTQTEVIWHYLRLSAWPDVLVLDYLDWPERKSLADVWPTAAGLAALLAVTAYGVIRNRAWAVPAAAFFLILAPTSSIVPIQDAAFEHRMYLPLACLVVLAVVGGWTAAAGRVPTRVLAGALVVVVVGLGFRAVVRNEDYSGATRLFAANAAARPANPRVRGVYADLLRQAGRVDEAEAEIKAAVALPRTTSQNALALGNVLYALGDTADAARYTRGVLAQAPDDPQLNAQLGLVLVAAGKPGEAVGHLEKARGVTAKDALVLTHLGIARAETGDAAGAAAAFAELKQLHPAAVGTLTALARSAALTEATKKVHLDMARRYADAARHMAGDEAAVLDAVALIRARVGDYAAAVTAAEAAAAAAERAGWKPEVVAVLRERIGLFKAGRPYLPADLAAYRGITP